MTKTIAIVQPVVPDYREPVFSALAKRYGDRFHVYAGAAAASNTTRSITTSEQYLQRLSNHYLFSESLLWQTGHEKELLTADLLILSGTLRTLSSLRLLIQRQRRKPTLLWGHIQGKHKILNWCRDQMLRASDGFIAYTESDAADATKLLPSNRVWSANNSCVWRADCQDRPQGSARPKDILFVGRLVANKKPMVLLTAFSELVDRDAIPRDVRLVFVGDGPERRSLEQSALSHSITDRVIFHGHVWRPVDLWPIYDGSLLATSPGYVGLSAIQAFARGLTIVVSRNERHSPEIEACREGFNAIFFKTDSAVDLAQTLQGCYTAANLLVQRRSAIAAAIAERYTYETMITAFQSAIDTFIA